MFTGRCPQCGAEYERDYRAVVHLDCPCGWMTQFELGKGAIAGFHSVLQWAHIFVHALEFLYALNSPIAAFLGKCTYANGLPTLPRQLGRYCQEHQGDRWLALSEV